MAHFLISDEKYRDLLHDDDYRSYLGDQGDQPGAYRCGRTREKRVRVHVRSALRRVNGYLKNMIEAIANAKLRRMERELELRGIRFDRTHDNWVTRNPDQTSRCEDWNATVFVDYILGCIASPPRRQRFGDVSQSM